MGIQQLLNVAENNLNSQEKIQHLTYLLAADRILYTDTYSAGTKQLYLPEVIERNSELLSVFPEFFQNLNTENIDESIVNEITALLQESELLHLPGRIHEGILSAGVSSQRKRQGSYYTPTYIITYMADTSIKYLTEKSSASILKDMNIIDPACGGGSFLIEYLHKLLDNNVPVERAIKSIYGTDIDKRAVAVSIFALTLAVKNRAPSFGSLQQIKQLWHSQIRNGDALSRTSEGIINGIDWPKYFPSVLGPECIEPGYDVVIGNPPYVSNKLIPSAKKKYYKDNYLTASGQYDLAVLFMEQGLDLLKNGGVLSYLTSNKFMAADYGLKLREMLVNSYEICEIIDVSTLKNFKNTAVYPVIFSARKTPPGLSATRIYNISSWEKIKDAKPVLVGREVFTGNSGCILTTRLDSTVLPIMRKIEKAGLTISENKIHCGLASSGFSRWVKKEAEIAAAQKNNYLPFIQAGHITSYSIKSHDFIDITCFNSGKWQSAVKGPKLVIPGIAKKLTAAVDDKDRLAGRVYFIRLTDTEYDLYYLAALFNSYLLDFYYSILYWSAHLEGGYLRYNSTYLANIPVVPSTLFNYDKAGLINSIKEVGSQLVSECLSDKLFWEKQCLANALTFVLYEISDAEAGLVMDFLHIPADTRNRVLSILRNLYK